MLSSCYFCGTALDAPVEEYRVVPELTVTLCPTCRRKLAAVVEAVTGDAPDAAALDAAELEDTNRIEPLSEPEADATAATDAAGPATAGDGQSADGDAIEEDDGANEGGITDASAEPGPQDGADFAVGPAGDATEPADDADGHGDEGSETRDGDAADGEDDATASGGGVTDVASGGQTGNGQSAGETEDETGADDEFGADEDGQPSILSTPAAKKVVRLLQNREFPVDREEFQTVAANAYDIPRQDCEDVVDALVEAGYVDEDGDRLVRPE